MLMGPGWEINTLSEIETCSYTVRALVGFFAPLRVIIINKHCNKISVQGVTSSVSSTAVLGTSDDALSVSFLLNYLRYEFLESFCALHLKKNLIFEKAPKKSASSVAGSIHPKVFLQCLCSPGRVLGGSNTGPCPHGAYILSARQTVSK